jgi:hypothetical protein
MALNDCEERKKKQESIHLRGHKQTKIKTIMVDYSHHYCYYWLLSLLPIKQSQDENSLRRSQTTTSEWKSGTIQLDWDHKSREEKNDGRSQKKRMTDQINRSKKRKSNQKTKT